MHNTRPPDYVMEKCVVVEECSVVNAFLLSSVLCLLLAMQFLSNLQPSSSHFWKNWVNKGVHRYLELTLACVKALTYCAHSVASDCTQWVWSTYIQVQPKNNILSVHIYFQRFISRFKVASLIKTNNFIFFWYSSTDCPFLNGRGQIEAILNRIQIQ